MSLLRIAWRSLQERTLSTVLTGLSMALGVALVVAMLVTYAVVRDSFNQSAQGYQLIVGAKGGRLQLVLNTVFHLSTPIENIPWSYYEQFLDPDSEFGAVIDVAIPYCLGDNVQGFRVVGTTPDMFEKLKYASGKSYEFHQGRNFRADRPFEAVLGYTAAARLGFGPGSRFAPTHGVSSASEATHVHHEEFEVVGVLAPTGTANDRAVFVNVEGFFLLEGHSKSGKKGEDAAAPAGQDWTPLPKEDREVTAILLRCADDMVGSVLYTLINEGNVAQAAFPIQEVRKLMDDLVGNVLTLLMALAVLIVVVAGIGIMVAMYNAMAGRQHEIAVMRALGARRTTVMAIVMFESCLLSLAGGIGGLILGHGMLGLLSPVLVHYTGVSVGFFQFNWQQEAWVIPLLVVLVSLVGIVPAMTAYRTDVSRSLGRTP